MEEIVIVGGGIAGLSCLNALLDHGVSPLLLEGGAVGTPKMCGEFLAPTAVACLNKWGIGPIEAIHQADFFIGKQSVSFQFPNQAGAMSRSEVECQLAARAAKLGGRIREKSHIAEVVPATTSTPFRFILSSGEEIKAKTVFFATGKFGQFSSSTGGSPYVGLKLHFKHIVKPATLQMYSVKDAYFGIVPISNEMSNCACLAKREAVEKEASFRDYFFKLIESNASLKSMFAALDIQEITWLEGRAAPFHLKKNPAWKNAYWIGDSYATLYPAIGSGFAHGIESAIQAVDSYLANQQDHYATIAKASVKPKLFWGKLLNEMLMRPDLSRFGLPLLRRNKWVIRSVLSRLEFM